MEEKEKETTIELGTLYDVNKSIVQNSEKELSQGVINSKKEEIKNFLRKMNNRYYMLLCNERRDYTVFDLELDKENAYDIILEVLIDECLKNRGEIRGIDITKDKMAIEIWLLIEKGAFVYYFFPCDNGVINAKEELKARGLNNE